MRISESRALWGGASRAISVVGMLGLIVGLGAVATRPALAEIQNDAIGFSSNHVFASGESGEHIDVMSGNMSLAIPIGPSYKLNDNFGYGLTLYYNSKIWEHDCPQGYGVPHPCAGNLPAYDTYGLGFSLLPGRVYHHDHDKNHVYRLQLEDGADHFFCDGSEVDTSCPRPYTTDGTNIEIRSELNATGQHGWLAVMPDGRKIYFLGVLNESTHEALATRIESADRRPDGTAAQWVNYGYSSGYQLTSITDSQGRVTTITHGFDSDDIAIDVPSFANQSSLSPATARYILRRSPLGVTDPSDGVEGVRTMNVLTTIVYPPPVSASETYDFVYSRGTGSKYGWLLQRKLPTGAIVDYFYDSYRTSELRPYHTELKSKTLRLSSAVGEPEYRWSWTRFNSNTTTVSRTQTFLGSNPYQINVLDPFGNLSRYDFNYSSYDAGPACANGECKNEWYDGLLASVSTFVGPDPDSSRLVHRVDYEWDSDHIDPSDPTSAHVMFQYRTPVAASPPPRVHSTAVRARKVSEVTTIPGHNGSPTHVVKVANSEWSGMCPRRRDEYTDGVLYRSTYTSVAYSIAGSAACLFPNFIEVTDGSGNVISRTDQKYDASNRLECEVRRNGPTVLGAMDDCSTDETMELQRGDVATVNHYDASSGVTTSTVVQGGDAQDPPRTTYLSYLDYPESGGGGGSQYTGYLTMKRYGLFPWMALNRDIDFNTGLALRSYDPAGNTTRYAWDALGRLTKIEPTYPERPTEITYTNLHETVVRQELATGDFIESVYYYDNLGRLVTTMRRNASGGADTQKTEYDIAGRVTRKSEWVQVSGHLTDFRWTTYDYTMYTDPDAPPDTVSKHADPLGRIHGVTTPDHPTPETPTVETSYDGSTSTVTVRGINGWSPSAGVGVDVTSTTVYTKDALGRLVSVDSP